MNSRERVLTTLNMREPDRVPIDFCGLQTGIHILAYQKLLGFLKIKDPNPRFLDIIQHVALPCEELLERFHVDTRYLYFPNSILDLDNYPDMSSDGKYRGVRDQFGIFWGEPVTKDKKDILYLDPVIHPLAECKSVEDVHNFKWPNGKDKKPFTGVKQKARKLRSDNKFAIVSPVMGNTYEYTNFLFGFTQSLRLLMKQPEIIVATMEELLKYWKDYVSTFYKEVEGCVDVICVNGDLCEQAGPIINPEIYRKLVKPLDKNFSEFVHKLGPVKINYHTCGSASVFIPDFIDIGYEAYNPVQLGAYDMDSLSLKQRFGKKITFWGGLCDTRILAFGTPEDVKKEVMKNINNFMPGGGYIAANIHNITGEVKPENIIAMFDTVYEYGKSKDPLAHFGILADSPKKEIDTLKEGINKMKQSDADHFTKKFKQNGGI
jgi:uroporphyrinogen decarboxylase